MTELLSTREEKGKEIMAESSTRGKQKEEWWKDYCLPSMPDEIPLVDGQRLIAVGDVHGSLEFLQESLIAARLIVESSTDGWNWIGGNAILVQVGDILDRGQEEEACIKLLTKLARQAAKEGGAVVILWGNHEASNSVGDFSFTNRQQNAFVETLGPVLDTWKGNTPSSWRDSYKVGYLEDSATRFASLAPGGPLSEHFLSKLKVAVKVGRTVLVHGGLTRDHLVQYGGIRAMNETAQKWILQPAEEEFLSANERAMALEADQPDFFKWMGTDGPTLMRDYSMPFFRDEPKITAMVDEVLKELDADRLVIGHTVQRKGVNSVLDEKVWRVDVGSEKTTTNIALEVFQCQDGEEKVSVVKRS